MGKSNPENKAILEHNARIDEEKRLEYIRRSKMTQEEKDAEDNAKLGIIMNGNKHSNTPEKYASLNKYKGEDTDKKLMLFIIKKQPYKPTKYEVAKHLDITYQTFDKWLELYPSFARVWVSLIDSLQSGIVDGLLKGAFGAYNNNGEWKQDTKVALLFLKKTGLDLEGIDGAELKDDLTEGEIVQLLSGLDVKTLTLMFDTIKNLLADKGLLLEPTTQATTA